ncbi:hypothetical protein [Mangrovimonas sp. YM274]|uniref:hypothetical protein n=1 Tax=Mangrovimonas sp. YM274 TaxID=3070660 RepID=UPI0027DBCB2C|nr:hypothetical protein [Mangrovimonas sp. YM274]WMI69626.1 hypothetical protein RBH95_04465 [Mangrovimonas sp. YM274]
MKKIITLCLFMGTLLFGAGNLAAQNTIEINKIASEKAESLRKVIKFDTDTLEEVYQAYKDYETKYQAISSDLKANWEAKVKIDKELDQSMKNLLTEDQYFQYKNLSAN